MAVHSGNSSDSRGQGGSKVGTGEERMASVPCPGASFDSEVAGKECGLGGGMVRSLLRE